MFFHCTITMICDSISAVGSAWHTPSISTAPSGSLPPLSLLHLTPPTSRLARKWKICFQLTFASTHQFSPFHSLLITVIPKWPPNELSISCKTCFHMSCILNVRAIRLVCNLFNGFTIGWLAPKQRCYSWHAALWN